MKTIHAAAPLLALGVFGIIYWNHDLARETRLAAQRAHDEAARQAKQRALHEARTQALADALAARETRAREQAEKTRREDEQKHARSAQEQRAQSALAAATRLRTQLERVKAECERMESAVGRAEERRRELDAEREFLARCVQQAEENRAAYLALLEKLEAAERLRAASPPPGPPRRTG